MTAPGQAGAPLGGAWRRPRPWPAAVIAALAVAGCAGPSPVIVDQPRLGSLEVDVQQESGRVRFRAYRPLWGKWSPGVPMPQPILEARVARPWGRPLWQVRTADPQAAVPVVPYPGALPGYARAVPALGPAPDLEPGARYEVWLRDGRGWRRAEFVYRPDARTPDASGAGSPERRAP